MSEEQVSYRDALEKELTSDDLTIDVVVIADCPSDYFDVPEGGMCPTGDQGQMLTCDKCWLRPVRETDKLIRRF